MINKIPHIVITAGDPDGIGYGGSSAHPSPARFPGWGARPTQSHPQNLPGLPNSPSARYTRCTCWHAKKQF